MMKLLNNRGVTLIELIFSMIIIGVIMTPVTLSFFNFKQFIQKKEEELINYMDKEVAFKYLWKDVSLSSPSFNNVTIMDDNNQSFFEYFGGCPEFERDNNEPVRKLTISTQSSRKQVTFIILNPQITDPVFINPVNSYKVGPAPTDFRQSGELEFLSLNNKDQVIRQNPDVWKSLSYLYVYTPVEIRDENTELCDFTSSPKVPSYIGQLKGKRVIKIDNGLTFDYANPLSQEGEDYLSEDDFLRRVPIMGGSAPVVLMAPVYLVTYTMEVDKRDDKNVNILYRTLDVGFNEPVKQVVAVGVDSVVFTRKNLTSNMINIELVASESDEFN